MECFRLNKSAIADYAVVILVLSLLTICDIKEDLGALKVLLQFELMEEEF